MKALRSELLKFGGVRVTGGNTFVLRRPMSASGFDQVLRELHHDPNFVYARTGRPWS